MNWILITGTSSGLGEATCKHLLGSGYSIFATIRNKQVLPVWVNQLASSDKDRLYLLQLDLGNLNNLSELISEIDSVLLRTNGKITALVNNAGVCVTGPLEVLREDQLKEQIQVNWLAPILITQKLLPYLRKSRGKIINIGSAAGTIAMPFLSAYASSKFAMEAWSDSLRREVRSQGVGVVLLQVGSISTPIWKKLEISANEHLSMAKPEQKELYKASMLKFLQVNTGEAQKRKTRPENVAMVIEKVLGKNNPPARIRVGGDAKLNAIVTKIIPDKVLDWVLCKLVNP